MTPAFSILVVEDDPAMRDGLRDNLEFEGYQVVTARSVQEGRGAALARHPSLILLDVMLPDGSGIELCRQLRAHGLRQPILMLTARGEEMDRVIGLESGADDYIVKPFSLRELLARVRANLRRGAEAAEPGGTVRVGVATVDFARHVLTRDGHPLETSAKEFALLRCLVAHRGLSVSRDTLLAEVWGHQEDVVTRTVDNFVVRLRRKIEPDPTNPQYLLTIHGSGYKLIAQ
jgi:DNA-binding response OmpR family regulator